MSINYDQEIDALVRTGVYRDRGEVIQDALNTFLALKSNLRLEIAIELFKSDEVSLLRASEIAGINFYIFKKILNDRGIKIPVDVETTDVMDRQIENFEKLVLLSHIRKNNGVRCLYAPQLAVLHSRLQ